MARGRRNCYTCKQFHGDFQGLQNDCFTIAISSTPYNQLGHNINNLSIEDTCQGCFAIVLMHSTVSGNLIQLVHLGKYSPLDTFPPRLYVHMHSLLSAGHIPTSSHTEGIPCMVSLCTTVARHIPTTSSHTLENNPLSSAAQTSPLFCGPDTSTRIPFVITYPLFMQLDTFPH